MRLPTLQILFLGFFSFTIAVAEAKTPPGPSPAPKLEIKNDFAATEVFKGSDAIWGFDFISETELIFTEKPGRIAWLDLKSGRRQVLAGGPKALASGQGGMLDVRLFRENAKISVFITASVSPEKGEPGVRSRTQTTALFRANLVKNGDTYVLEGLTRLFEAEPGVDSDYHFGSRVVMTKEGGIFVSLGERNDRDRAQDLTQHWGKILRLGLDGKPFPTNPFIKGEKVAGVIPRPEIYSSGHRNPQGLALHPKSGELFESEHGPRGGDEINKIVAGKNYGWPKTTYGREYWGPSIAPPTVTGFEQPEKYYVPSIAPSSLLIYSGKKYRDLEGKFLQGALVLKHVNIVDIETGAELRLFEKLGERIRNVGESPAGEIFISSDSGRIFRIDRKTAL